MNRRKFSLNLLTGLSATTGLSNISVFAQTAQASTVTPIEGKNYWTITPPVPTTVPEGKVLVLEFFAYSCGYCYQFMPVFEKWATEDAPKAAIIQRVPVAFREIVEPHSKLFYTLEALERLDLHNAAFSAVLVERKKLLTNEEISSFFVEHGIDPEKAMQIYNSFGIQTKVKQANQLVTLYGLQGTPAIGIGGKYRLSGANPENLALSDYFIAEVLKSE